MKDIAEHNGLNSKSDPTVIGKINNVKTSFISVSLDSLNSSNDDGTDLITVGDFVAIPSGQYLLFGQITDINSVGQSTKMIEFEANVKLLLSIRKNDKQIISGIATKPQVGGTVYVASPELIRIITNPNSRFKSDQPGISLQLAKLQHSSDIPVSFLPENLFGRHCAVFGTTGSGKSWSIAKMLEEAAKFNSKMILFDATGEFHTLDEKVTHVQLGEGSHDDQSITQVSMPYHELIENDLFAIFKPTGQSQALKLRTAIKTLKLTRLAPHLTNDGTVIKAFKEKNDFEKAYHTYSHELEKPSANFDIEYLSRQIANECVKPILSATETNYWGEKCNAEHSDCVPLISRIDEMLESKMLAMVFKPGRNKSILTAVEEFLEDDQKSILRISLEHLSFEYSSREIIANAIGRFLLNLARTNKFKEQPVFMVVDEAHQFINNKNNDENKDYALDAFAIIAKEGRKYGLNIGIVTQRPRDLPEGVLSQIGTFIVHRLINDHDLSVIERASGQANNQSLEAIPILSPGEAVLLGVDFPFPMRIIFDEPKHKPNSAGPDFQKNWR